MNRSMDPSLARVAVNLYRYLSTPRALSCYILLKYEEWDQLVTMTVDPHTYLDTLSGAVKLRRDLMATDFLRKSDAVPASWDRVSVAENSFLECEKQCFRTNEFMHRLAQPLAENFSVVEGLNRFFDRVKKLCARIMGPVPDSLEIGFGPGTSFEMKGRASTTLVDKMLITPHVTSSCVSTFEHSFWPSLWGRERLRAGLPLPAICRGNRFTTVPKDAKTDRGICVEPLGNLSVQLGIGRHLKRRLAALGLYVDRSPPSWETRWCDNGVSFVHPRDCIGEPRPNGQTIHRNLAVTASVDGRMATIDLSNASDTVAFELVKRVIPGDWFDLLSSARSPLTLFKGSWTHLEKFSSMGNGFTFELETLIFAAISSVASAGRIGESVFVYGDDIIVPSHSADTVIRALETFGFKANPRKTFTSSAFRESCGGDYFAGWAVRAYQSKTAPVGPLDWMVLHNALKRWLPSGAPRSRVLLSHLIEQVPRPMRVSGPKRLGDVVFHTRSIPWRTRPARIKINGSIFDRGWDECQGLVPTPTVYPLDRWSDEMLLPCALLGVASSGVSPRDSISGIRRRYFAIS